MTKAELISLPNGPVKKFQLLKTFGAELRARGHSVEYLRTLSCDEIVALIINPTPEGDER
jgi:hypothetical protein